MTPRAAASAVKTSKPGRAISRPKPTTGAPVLATIKTGAIQAAKPIARPPRSLSKSRASARPKPMDTARGSLSSAEPGQRPPEAHAWSARSADLSPDDEPNAPRIPAALRASSDLSPRARDLPKPTPPPPGASSAEQGQKPTEAHRLAALPADPLKPERANPQPKPRALAPAPALSPVPELEDPDLAFLAGFLYDFEEFRKASANRLRAATTPKDKADEDGKCRGLGLSVDDSCVHAAAETLLRTQVAEDEMVLELKRRFRGHPLHPFVAARKGLGEKTVARLLGAIGDPYWNGKYGRPRTVGELWAYCGLHGSNGHRAKGYRCDGCGAEVLNGVKKNAPHGCGGGAGGGVGRWQAKTNWSGQAKMRTFLCIEPCIKLDGKPDKNGRARAKSPYRTIYEDAKAKAAEHLHTDVCARCGPKGKPAKVGSPWSDGHKHGHAMRIARKELLRDLWLEAKRIHENAGTGQNGAEAQGGGARPGANLRAVRTEDQPPASGRADQRAKDNK